MPALSVTLDTGRRYLLLGLIDGTLTTGVTRNPVTATRPGQTHNVDRLTLNADPANGANNVAYGDGAIAINGTSGRIMLAGDVQLFQGPPCQSLIKYIAVTGNGTILNVEWN